MESGTLAKVRNDFFTTVDGELTLCKGDYFLVHRVIDKHWCYGESRDRVGKFPSNYLLQVQLPRLEDSEKLFISTATFLGQDDGDLSFSEGELIIGVQEAGNDWYYGCIDGRKGIFPISHTWQANTGVLKRALEVKTLRRKARVTASLTAQLDGELDLRIGDIVTVTQVLQDGWCHGVKEDGTAGTFPNDFVVYIADDESDQRDNVVVETVAMAALGLPAQVDDGSKFTVGNERISPHPSKDSDSIPSYNDLFPEPSVLSSLKSSEKGVDRQADLCPSTSIQPYAITLYAFEAEFPNELSFQPGEMILLIRYIDVEWLEGSKHGTRGIFPASYVNIVENAQLEVGIGNDSESVRDSPPTPDNDLTHEKKSDSPTDSFFEDFVILRRHESHTETPRIVSEPHRSAPPPPPQPPPPSGLRTQNSTDASSNRQDIKTRTDVNSPDNGKERRADQRQNVISELVLTEKEYVRDLKLTYQVFQLHDPNFLESRGIDVAVLFGNILDVIVTAEDLLDTILRAMKGVTEEEQKIGPCFLKMAEKLQSTYVKYCGNHEAALILLRKYEGNEEIVNLFNKAIESLRCQIACFDMSSILIKPVQRILKYPLILRELQKFTDNDHQDKRFIEEACTTMARVADYINESKRRKDLVSKYLESENTLRKRIANLNMHSVAKISTRLSTKLSASFGLTNIPAHPEFEELERQFHSIEKCTWQLSKDVEQCLAYLNIEALSGEVISDLLFQYYQGISNAEAQNLRDIRSTIRSFLLKDLKSSIEARVSTPIGLLNSLLEGPAVLIMKRQDKMLDYDAAISRSDKYKDSRMVQEELTSTKCNYEALTQQLLEELPALVDAATKILAQCVSAFAHARKLVNGKVTQRYLSICEASSQLSPQDIVESFLINHNLLWNQMQRFAFAGMRPATYQSNERPSFVQSELQRMALKSKYPTDKLYMVTESVESTSSLDVGASKGTLVAVMKQQDPMGNLSRWFIDNGLTKGFLPADKLTPITIWEMHPRQSSQSDDSTPDTTPDLISMDSPEKKTNNHTPKSHLDDLLTLNVQPATKHTPSNEFYYALFDFDTNLPGTLSINQGQVVRLVRPHDEKGNNEWWFVEDRNQQSGYVPTNYLKELPPHNA